MIDDSSILVYYLLFHLCIFILLFLFFNKKIEFLLLNFCYLEIKSRKGLSSEIYSVSLLVLHTYIFREAKRFTPASEFWLWLKREYGTLLTA